MSHVHSARIVIHGQVQGVGFRYWLAGEAQARQLSGWVRNRRDGAVEAVFSGDEPVVKDMITACSLGPRFAEVSRIELIDDAIEAVAGFSVRPTV